VLGQHAINGSEANEPRPLSPVSQVIRLESRKKISIEKNFQPSVSTTCTFPPSVLFFLVEGLYCKRPIQCLASSEIFPPPPPPPARLFSGAGGRTHSLGGGGGWGVNILTRTIVRKARHCSVLYICKYFVVFRLSV
jgi:hypothetical protein